MKTAFLFATALIAAPAAAQMMPPPTTTVAQPFLMMAAEGDIFEITTSQIALMRSQNPDVRRYATEMIAHHTMTTNTALRQAKAAGVTPPPSILMAPKRDMISQLLAASPAEFDRVFVQQQIPAHEEALAINRTYAESGDTAPLREAATSALPFITKHLADARRMAAAM